MNYKSVITKLYVQLINSDGKVNDTEISLGKKMMEIEGISPVQFDFHLQSMKGSDSEMLYQQSVRELRRLSSDLQIRCIAWLCLLANADGFMDRKEWQFIYKIYHKELNLPLPKIMDLQKELLKKMSLGQPVDWTPPLN